MWAVAAGSATARKGGADEDIHWVHGWWGSRTEKTISRRVRQDASEDRRGHAIAVVERRATGLNTERRAGHAVALDCCC